MSNIARMMQRATAGAGGAGLNVEEVFSTYLYDGSSGTQLITNGIDLAGEGGMTWFKRRNGSSDHQLFDSERTGRYRLESNTTDAQVDEGATVWNTQSTGFYIGGDGGSQIYNSNGDSYASWTFRKAPKFFDIVTYSGNGSSSRTISHSLRSVPGMIMIKRLDTAVDWMVYHRGVNNGTNPANYYLTLNGNDAAHETASPFNNTTPTESVFSVGGSANTNHSSGTYVAYLFAHNDGDGGFGADADQDIVKCGYAVTPASAQDLEINLGFEPQFVMYKLSGTGGSWYVHDAMRSLTNNNATDPTLYWNNTYHETQITSNNFINPTATGFRLTGNAVNQALGTNANFVYFAIRRGTKVPESATEVFDVYAGNDSSYKIPTGFTTDLVIGANRSGSDKFIGSRLTGLKGMRTNTTQAEGNGQPFPTDAWTHNDGVKPGFFAASTAAYWLWKRAPNYFDVVAYTGQSGAQVINHNLGVVPEMIWIKKRSEVSYYGFVVYHGTTGNMYLSNNFSSGYGGSNAVNHSTISDTTFQLANGNIDVNDVGETHIAYLFASLDGVSKVGSYTGDGSTSKNIECGFSNGARFVLIKRTDNNSDWFVFDSARGINSGTEPRLELNNTDAEPTATDQIDPYSGGFNLASQSSFNINISGASYIFYAIA